MNIEEILAHAPTPEAREMWSRFFGTAVEVSQNGEKQVWWTVEGVLAKVAGKVTYPGDGCPLIRDNRGKVLLSFTQDSITVASKPTYIVFRDPVCAALAFMATFGGAK